PSTCPLPEAGYRVVAPVDSAAVPLRCGWPWWSGCLPPDYNALRPSLTDLDAFGVVLLGAARTAFRIPCRADDPCAGDNCECEESLDEGEPSARWRQCPGARPAKRRQRFSKGGDKRGSVAPPQLA